MARLDTVVAAVFVPLLLLNALFLGLYKLGLTSSEHPDVVHQLLFSSLLFLVFYQSGSSQGEQQLLAAGPEVGASKEAVSTSGAAGAAAPSAAAAEGGEVEEGQVSEDVDAEHIARIPALLQNFLTLVQSDPATDPASPWSLIKEINSRPIIKVYQNSKAELSFKIIAELDADAADAFEALADTTARNDWDEMTAEAKIVEILDERSRIVYLRTKAIFPVSARDLVTLSHITTLTEGDLPPAWVNVTTSVVHPDAPPRQGIVRMSAGVAGQMVRPIVDEMGAIVPGRCKVVQLVDGDLGGSVPSWLVAKVAGGTIPTSLQKLNKHLIEYLKNRNGPRVPSFVENGFDVPPAKRALIEARKKRVAEGGPLVPVAARKVPAAVKANGHVPQAKEPKAEHVRKLPPKQGVDLSAFEQFNDYLPAIGLSAAAVTVGALFFARRILEE